MGLERKKVSLTPAQLKTIEDNKTDNAEVLALQIHERCWVRSCQKYVCRVQSGWLYSDWDGDTDKPYNTIFVLDTRE